MLDTIDRLLSTLRSKAGTWVGSAEDRANVEQWIITWKRIRPSVGADPNVTEALDKLAEAGTQELAKPHPSRKGLLGALGDFRSIYYEKVHVPGLVEPRGYVSSRITEILERLGSEITDPLEQDYFKEALRCQSVASNRSYVVVFWSIIMHRIYKSIVERSTSDFSAAYIVRYGAKRPVEISGLEDFFDISDKQVIDTCYSALGWIDKHQWEVLDAQRKLRNRCAHVSVSYKPDETNILHFTSELTQTILRRI